MIEYVNLPEGTDQPMKTPSREAFTREIAKRVAQRNVIGIIAANTSQTAPSAIDEAGAFHIPVFLAVATTEALTKHCTRYVLRMPATDRLQAQQIVAWLHDQPTNSNTPVIYDPRAYGTGLRDALRSLHGPLSFMEFSLASTTDVVDILEHGRQAKVQSWIVLGYREQAIDIVAKMQFLEMQGHVLLSDGCYGEWVSHVPARGPELFLVFPLPTQMGHHAAAHTPRLKGYAPFGHDALILLAAALDKARGADLDKSQLITYLEDATLIRNNEKKLLLHYNYENSENLAATFAIHSLTNGITP